MIILILIFLFATLIIFLIKNKIVLRVDTFFRKGFSKDNDRYRSLLLHAGSRETGKTYSIVDTLNTARKGKIVITNVKSYSNIDKKNIIYEPDFSKIYFKLKNIDDCSNYIVFYDEIFTLIEKGKLSPEMLSFLSQMRKRRLYFYTTAQEWLEINVTFRRYVRYQVDCKMFNLPLFNCAFSINRINDAYQMKWDNMENEYVCPIIKTTIKKCSKKLADSYDTFETIQVKREILNCPVGFIPTGVSDKKDAKGKQMQVRKEDFFIYEKILFRLAFG